MAFAVASYNILADAYIKPERYPDVAPGVLDPEHRRPALLQRIAGLGADVLCLQEVEQDAFDTVAERLRPAGYAGQLARKQRGQPDGCAVFVRPGAVALREARTLVYDDEGQEPLGFVALLVALAYEGRTVGVATTHLKWDPPDTPAAERRGLQQIRQLLAQRDTLLPGCAAWVLCGDFNAPPESAVADLVRAAGFLDAYAGRSDQNTYNRHQDLKRIDYLFHTQTLRAEAAAVPIIEASTPLPSPQEPSDHLPVMASFAWAAAA